MRFIVLACDYDETLATAGRVGEEGISALKQLAASGRKLLLVTGRELEDLLSIFPEADLFDRIVAENGGVLYRPAARETERLAERPPKEFLSALSERGVAPLSVGEVIVSTREPYQEIVLETIRDLGLALQVIFNKGAVMVLPSGINKGTGLSFALRELGLSPRNCLAIGDAENDHAFLGISECSAAVANALPTLKERADIVTSKEATGGVIEVVEQLLADDLRRYQELLGRHDVLVGRGANGSPVHLRSCGTAVLIAGPPDGGECSVASALLERIVEQGYQCCLVDPEGDCQGLERAVLLGSNERAPAVEEVLQVLGNPDLNCAVSLSAIPIRDRPSFFAALLPRLEELRARTGRPHWIAVAEADQLLPSARPAAALALPKELQSMIFATAEPGRLTAEVLLSVDEVIASGGSVPSALEQFAAATGAAIPPAARPSLDRQEAIIWRWRRGEAPMPIRIGPARLALPGARRRRRT